MTDAECPDCGELLEHPRNLTYLTIEQFDQLALGMNCKNCNEMLTVWTEVQEVTEA